MKDVFALYVSKRRSRNVPRPVYGVTWSCPRCGRPFTTQVERDLHWLSCGA